MFVQSTAPKIKATGTFTHVYPRTAHKNAQKSSKNFKPRINNVVGTGTNFAIKIWLPLYLSAVRLTSPYRGKMQSHHLFPYGGFSQPHPRPGQIHAIKFGPKPQTGDSAVWISAIGELACKCPTQGKCV